MPEFNRNLKVNFEETDLARARFAVRGTNSKVMLDVGAHHGTSTEDFAIAGWRVHAFEPDPTNRKGFVRRLGSFENVTVDERAVSDVDGNEVTLFASEESSGITSMLAFTEGHEPIATIKTVRLDTFMAEQNITDVDFLKIDTEGYDLMVLQGFPWGTVRPPVVLCEFEDNKTTNLGYSTEDMLAFLTNLGYTLLVSEWHPIERYGIAHSFRRITRYDKVGPPTSSWGNILAVTDPDDADLMMELAPSIVKRRASRRDVPLRSLWFDVWRKRATKNISVPQ
jgi:FkbM family methyltransferase